MSLEREIKAVVLSELLRKGTIDSSSLVFSEMNLAKKVRRVDLGYIRNAEMVAIEIKSEKDSLVRLAGQLSEYSKYFDRVILVVALKFVHAAMEIAADEVGIWSVSDGLIKVVRKGRVNRSIRKSDYVELMTKREICALARKIGINPGELPMYDLKLMVLAGAARLSKADVKSVLIDGIHKRFGMASRRFMTKVSSSTGIEDHDVRLLSPYIGVTNKNE